MAHHFQLPTGAYAERGFGGFNPPPLHWPNSDEIQGIRYLADRYNSDINCSVDVAAAELDLWYSYNATIAKQPVNALEAFCVCDADRLPAIKRLLQIFATLPVSTATSERSFSTLRRLKNYLRNTTGEERLNGLAMMNVLRKIEVDPERVVNEMCAKLRRLPFLL